MKRIQSAKLTDTYEDLMFLEQQGKLSFTGKRELVVCKFYLFGYDNSYIAPEIEKEGVSGLKNG
jgi:hypothetical protein